MIKSFGELGDVLAEFENRLSYLELSAGGTQTLEGPREPKIELRRYVSYERVDGKQLSALRKNLVQHIDKKFQEFQDKGKVDKQGRYTKYK